MPLLSPPGPVLAIARRLEEAGYETWCVGGAVRDALLGIPDLDWDLATAAHPKDVQRLFKRVVPVGIEHGTVGVLDDHGTMHEVTTFRRDVTTDGRHAEVAFGVSLDDDLARRDFTINAIAYSPSRDELRDPFGGRDDLLARRVRAVGDADARMREDRLRALRAIRFASRFSFEIEAGTWNAIVASAPHLGRLSAERVRQEIEKTMDQVVRPSEALRRWKSSGAFRVLLPALDSVSDVALATADYLPMPGPRTRPARRINRLTGLLLELGGKGAERVCKLLKCSNSDTQWISGIAARWADVGTELTAMDAAPSDGALRALAARVTRPRVAPLLRVAAARWHASRAAGGVAPASEAAHSLYRRAVRIAWRDPIELADLAVDGDDLREAGVPAGPALGAMLHRLLAAVIEDPSRNTRDALMQIARHPA
jgi:tRNA nucleotidyltransferase (CCA-adding enzyme)